MKIKLLLFLVILCLLQSVSLKSQTNNLVVNGDFEGEVDANNMPFGWTTSYSHSCSVTDAAAKEGTKSLNMNVQSIGDIFQDIAIEAGEKYKFSFWYNAYNIPISEGLQLIFNWRRIKADGTIGEAAGASINSEFLTCVSAWRKYQSEEMTAPDNAGFIRLFINGNNNIGVYIDDVQIVKVSDVITGLSAVKAELPVRSENGNLVVSGAPAGSRIDVYSLVGNRLQSAVAAQGETVIPNLPKGQVLIVRSGNEAAKVAL